MFNLLLHATMAPVDRNIAPSLDDDQVASILDHFKNMMLLARNDVMLGPNGMTEILIPREPGEAETPEDQQP